MKKILIYSGTDKVTMGSSVTLDNFHIIKNISRGAFGEIVMARRRHASPTCDVDAPVYAIKRVKKSEMVKCQLLAQVQAERDALALTASPFVVRIFYSFLSDRVSGRSSDVVNLVMEYLPGGDLKSLLHQQGCFPPAQASLYTAEMAQALHYLHRRHIIHRDVKPDNILVTQSGHIKLTDFGLCHVPCDGHGNNSGQLGLSQLLTSPYTPSSPSHHVHRTPGQVLSLTSQLTGETPIPVPRSEIVRATHRNNTLLSSLSGPYNTSRLLLSSPSSDRNNELNVSEDRRRDVPSLASDDSLNRSTSSKTSRCKQSTDEDTPVLISRTRSRTLSLFQLRQPDTSSDRRSSTCNLSDVFDNDDDDSDVRDVDAPSEVSWSEPSPVVSVRMTRKRSRVGLDELGLSTGLSQNLGNIRIREHSTPVKKRASLTPSIATALVREKCIRFATPTFLINNNDALLPTTGCDDDVKPSRIQTPYRTPMTSARARHRRWSSGNQEQMLGQRDKVGNNRDKVGSNRDKVLGTPHYMAPEAFSLPSDTGGIKVTPSVDWWALGVCLFEFLTGYLPFTGANVGEVFERIRCGQVDWPDVEEMADEDMDPSHIRVIQSLLTQCPDSRATLDDLKHMEMFREFDFNHLLNVEPAFVPVLDDPTDTFYFNYRNEELLINRQESSIGTTSDKENLD